MSSLRVGVIGGSQRSAVARAHRTALQVDGLFSVVSGVFGSSPASSLDSGKLWRVAASRRYPSLAEFISGEKSKIDLVVVLTPPALHFEQCGSLLRAGFDVLVEKPAAMDSDEVRALEIIAGAAGKHLFVIQNYLVYPRILDAREHLSRGTIGAIRRINIVMPQQTFVREDEDQPFQMPQGWRQEDRIIPTVSLDLGIHVVNLLHTVSNDRLASAQASAYSEGRVPNVVDHVDVLYATGSEVGGLLSWGKTSLGEANGLALQIFGAKGSMKWKQTSPDTLLLSDLSGERRIFDQVSASTLGFPGAKLSRFKPGHPEGFVEGLANYYLGIAAIIRPSYVKKLGLAVAGDAVKVLTISDVLVDFEALEAIHKKAIIVRSKGSRELGKA